MAQFWVLLLSPQPSHSLLQCFHLFPSSYCAFRTYRGEEGAALPVHCTFYFGPIRATHQCLHPLTPLTHRAQFWLKPRVFTTCAACEHMVPFLCSGIQIPLFFWRGRGGGQGVRECLTLSCFFSSSLQLSSFCRILTLQFLIVTSPSSGHFRSDHYNLFILTQVVHKIHNKITV